MYAFFSASSPTKSEQLSPSRERSERSACSTASPTNSIASSMRTTSSTMSSGIKSRQIRDLKMELEFRDDRIHELETAYEELERKADFARGEVESKMADQRHELEVMSSKHDELSAVIQAQSQQLSALNSTVEQYKSMQSMMAALMGRCKELEDAQRAQEEAQRQAKLESERAAAAAAELAAEEARMKAERLAAEAKQQADAEVQQAALVAQAQVQQQPAAPRTNMSRFRPNSTSAPAGRRECSVM